MTTAPHGASACRASHAHALAAAHFPDSGSELVVGGFTASDLAGRFGTPLYCYDAAILQRQLSRLRGALDTRFDVHFSVKSNPNSEILKVFVAMGAGLEVASAAEYARARHAGAPPERILFAGPAKTDDELRYVTRGGIGEIHVESLAEITRLSAIAAQERRDLSVALRINPAMQAEGGAMRMGGRAVQFGIDEAEMDEAARQVLSCERLRLTGLHFFAGTQILDAATVLRQWRYAIDVAGRFSKSLGRPLKTLDLGGGLGIPYFAGEAELDLQILSDGAREISASMKADSGLADTRMVIEPGRFLSGPAGIYLSRVINVKVSGEETFVITDGGMHHHLAASGNLGQVIKRDYPILVANRFSQEPTAAVTIVGPLCTPLDTYGRRTPLAAPRVGDLIAVLQSGAYGLTASPNGFLSHPMPAEVLLREGSATQIRPRGTFEQPITQLP